ncbi:YicC/YloC family endoribonuclease [Thermoanaerobacterium sp. RBIITD]|uniref:YicC/YloC family endoribonuclease n=1 Tax=Thermoanaerobacterium sp. RBIITD TaxID=1550240 RepID=UPI000BB91C6B|nr:YicC/YloC family endoribonuclease [Thermoanaerobacterium sp. RBIITD]SNX55604.1 TIGR00255 family protein [Thermoanaerobacterium sp. RBIITD]
MIKSMTGFGRGEVRKGGFYICIEIKTLNHRFLDIALKLPRQLNGLEERIRATIAKYIKRGRVEINVVFEPYEKGINILDLDNDLLEQYFKILESIKVNYASSESIKISDLLSLPDIIKVKNTDLDVDEVWVTFEKALSEGIKNLIDMRVKEGIKLKNDIINRLDILNNFIDKIEERSPIVVQEYKSKLETRIKELTNGNIDQSRFLTEVAIMADRTSITEEITRLRSHINQFKSSLDSDMPIGKKLDFITQEMNREVNTIGSKSMDIEITNGVIELKDQIEKIREQVQNIE